MGGGGAADSSVSLVGVVVVSEVRLSSVFLKQSALEELVSFLPHTRSPRHIRGSW